jgi:hypothetical protein
VSAADVAQILTAIEEPGADLCHSFLRLFGTAIVLDHGTQ